MARVFNRNGSPFPRECPAAAGRFGMNDRPLASIVISSYNYGRFLKDCIDSALNQTYPETEVIVVDDASSDDSREIIGSYANRIKPILREKNEGGRATYNAACRLSQIGRASCRDRVE